MNILLIVKSIDPKTGGVEVATQNLAMLFHSKGHTVFSANYTKDEGVQPYSDNFLIDQSNLNDTHIKLCSYIKKNKIDVIINQVYHHPYNTQLLIHIKQEVDVPIVSCLHTTPEYLKNVTKAALSPKSIKSTNDLIKWCLRILLMPYYLFIRMGKYKKALWNDYFYSDCYIVLSTVYRRMFKTLFSEVDIDKIKVIPNLITNNLLTSADTDKEDTIIYVGRLSKEKRVDIILDMWKRLSVALPLWTLKIIGDGPQYNQLASKIENEKIERVQLCGYTNSPIQYYNNAKILLLTSRFEGVPMVIIEASSRGVVPVVMNSFAAANDIIQNNITGIVTDNNDVDQMTEKIIELANNPQLLNNLSQNAQTQIRQRYSPDAIYQQWLSIFASVKK